MSVRWILSAGLAVLIQTGGGLAAVETSLRPVPRASAEEAPAAPARPNASKAVRPDAVEAERPAPEASATGPAASVSVSDASASETDAAPRMSPRPVARVRAAVPAGIEPDSTPMIREEARPALSAQAAPRSLRPSLRPPVLVERAVARREVRRRGMVCGSPDIQGEEIGRVPGRIGGCGVSDAVRVQSVSGVILTQRSVMDCGTARALNTWVTQTARPALSRTGGGLQRLKVAAHYACRTRNNLPGARISEHGKGRAIDISGFYLRDGTLLTVLRGWTTHAQTLRRLHRGACGPFGTVLGPDADSYHRDHFHFDTARYRSGRYCR
jgi:hypothetical protein